MPLARPDCIEGRRAIAVCSTQRGFELGEHRFGDLPFLGQGLLGEAQPLALLRQIGQTAQDASKTPIAPHDRNVGHLQGLSASIAPRPCRSLIDRGAAVEGAPDPRRVGRGCTADSGMRVALKRAGSPAENRAGGIARADSNLIRTEFDHCLGRPDRRKNGRGAPSAASRRSGDAQRPDEMPVRPKERIKGRIDLLLASVGKKIGADCPSGCQVPPVGQPVFGCKERLDPLSEEVVGPASEKLSGDAVGLDDPAGGVRA